MDYIPEDFMRRGTFEARLDEFSGISIKSYTRTVRKIMLKYGVTSWNEISELRLGKVFHDMEKALCKGPSACKIKRLV